MAGRGLSGIGDVLFLDRMRVSLVFKMWIKNGVVNLSLGPFLNVSCVSQFLERFLKGRQVDLL